MSDSFLKPNKEIFYEQRKVLDECMLRYLSAYPCGNSKAYEASAYSIQSGGHRWRPLLLFEIANLLAPNRDPDVLLPFACAIEFVHTASIILDDFPAMDDAVLRRGRKPCHLQFGEAPALMAALWLCDVAQHYIHHLEPLKQRHGEHCSELEDRFRLVKNEMILGQNLDLESNALTEEAILETYRLKSGALYAFAAAAPAWILGLNKEANSLKEFGHFLGIAYQLSDDIADVTSSPTELGKDVSKDVKKRTIPRLFGLERANDLRASFTQKAIRELQCLGKPVDSLIVLVEHITHCSHLSSNT